MRRAVGVVLAGAALALTGCSEHQPEVTFYADGQSTAAAPMVYCDEIVSDCQDQGPPIDLDVRPGQPVQISLPSEAVDTPWVIIVQYFNPETGEETLEQEAFTDGQRYAYTATPPTDQDRVAVVEIQQIGAAYAADQEGTPLADEDGQPQLVARAVWSLQNSQN
ncbi:hypothetical protein BJF85_21020 [Saccharomonospora sp. CUA-673]|uniref:DUF2771 family protein n=1 Tax=Saccharomonospora sp. CUA-673 TaxID=1904969 RepID=UPI0009696E37|nr:DUF2771 family protein [Saccharomonospora sp. CUA-673]OLT43871.1 hypothetical protein BJF85_21020 [Saccharomonospora sp. CUA-673]